MKRNFRTEQYVLLALCLALFIAILYPFLQGILLGLFVAIVFQPLHTKVQDKIKLPPMIASFLSTTVLSIFVVLPMFFIVYTLVKDSIALFNNSGDWIRQLTSSSFSENFLIVKIQSLFPEIGTEEFRAKLVEYGSQAGAYIAKVLGQLLAGIPDFSFQVLMFVLAVYYGLQDGPRFKTFILSVLPYDKEELSDLVGTTQQIVSGVMWGSLLAGLVQGFIIGVGFAILDVPRPLFFAMVTVIFSFIPMVGSLATGLGGAIYLAVQGSWPSAFVMLGIFLLASFSDNIVKPWALSGQSSMHPLLGLTSALGGLVVFGFLGLFLGPLVVALTISMLHILQRQEQAF